MDIKDELDAMLNNLQSGSNSSKPVKKAAVPVKPEKTVISIRLDADVLKVLDTLSNDTDISRNELIVQCIDYALKNFHQ